MSKKVFRIITGVVTGLQTIGVAIVDNLAPENHVAISSAIIIAGGAIIEICNLFVKE